jgi:hypothetical protein
MNSPNLTTLSLPPARRNWADRVLELCPQKTSRRVKTLEIQSPQMGRIHRPLTVAEVIGVSRSKLVERLQRRPPRLISRPPLRDEELVAQIKAAIAELPI